MAVKLNLGLGMAIPYSSGYAILRRALMANACPLHTLRQHLTTAPEKKEYLHHALIRHYPGTLQDTIRLEPKGSQRIVKNCPECAALGFHTMLFDYPWAKQCPVHHRPLSTHCPACDKPWPAIHTISDKTCHKCGLNTQSKYTVAGLNKTKTRMTAYLANIYQAIDVDFDRRCEIITSVDDIRTVKDDELNLTVDNELYPSYLAEWGSQPVKAALHDLGCTIKPIHAIHDQLTAIDEDQWLHMQFETPSKLKIKTSWTPSKDWELKTATIKLLLSYIRKKFGLRDITIYNYKWLYKYTVSHFHEVSIVLMAFTIWVLYILSRGTAVKASFGPDNYPFLRYSDYTYLISFIDTVYIRKDDSDIYYPSDYLREWVYRRSIENNFVIFYNILKLVFSDQQLSKIEFHNRIISSAQLGHIAHIDDDIFTLYYAEKSPAISSLEDQVESFSDVDTHLTTLPVIGVLKNSDQSIKKLLNTLLEGNY